ncbi:MAG: HD domain-containing protein [Methanospirillum sp.]|uniref:HD domain-containing protein n=1 Tax=Methanospirillum sp. TaxID=45200 RepID=UPI0023727872|nr:HD domain-containing protein [Methanospirillum sp.]MDD1729776.1 HD domain-containing protein [Methanospirillum sp.]
MNNQEEKTRYRLTSGSDLCTRVEVIEEYATRLLPFIPRGLPVYQSHGVLHSATIIQNINRIIRYSGFQITSEEVFYLYLAAWLHDLGYLHPLSIFNRSTHPGLSVEMIRVDQTIQGILNQREYAVLETIIRYHDTHTNLMDISEDRADIRVPLLAAVFRIADAIDIGTDRCPPEVFMLIEDGLNEHSRRHWQAHHNILGVQIDYPVITIRVRDPENPFVRRRIISHLEDDCQSSGWILKRYKIAPVTLECRKGEVD